MITLKILLFLFSRAVMTLALRYGTLACKRAIQTMRQRAKAKQMAKIKSEAKHKVRERLQHWRSHW